MADSISDGNHGSAFRQAVRRCLTRYARFSGRASRREFWWFWVFCLLGAFVMSALDSAVFGGGGPVSGGDPQANKQASIGGPFGGLFALAVIVPQLAAGWRRMHDTGRSGLFLIYPVIVLVGILSFAGMLGATTDALTGDLATWVADVGDVILGLAILVFALSPLLVVWWLTRPGDPRPNRYGAPPDF